MAYVPKDGTGSLFVNKFKKAENHPDREGTVMLNGVEYKIAGWLKETKEGEKFLSLTIKPKEDKDKSSGGEQKRDFRREREEFF